MAELNWSLLNELDQAHEDRCVLLLNGRLQHNHGAFCVRTAAVPVLRHCACLPGGLQELSL